MHSKIAIHLRKLIVSLAPLAMCAALVPADAQNVASNIVQNGSFENVTFVPFGIPSWVTVNVVALVGWSNALRLVLSSHPRVTPHYPEFSWAINWSPWPVTRSGLALSRTFRLSHILRFGPGALGAVLSLTSLSVRFQYRTLESNFASLRIADSLGFCRYATSVAVRLNRNA